MEYLQHEDASRKNLEKHNLEMNDLTYEARREVINIIYRLNNVLGRQNRLPRIRVRITDDKINAAGYAMLKQREIWIPLSYAYSKYPTHKYLYQVVLHEIVHAVTGFEHDNNCPLMHEHVQPGLSEEEATRIFINYITKKQ